MVSKQQAVGRGIRARNQAMIRIGGKQGRAADHCCFSTGITARGLFLGKVRHEPTAPSSDRLPYHAPQREERDRDFLAGVFSEVWATIPEEDKTAILSRGFGQGITVDVWGPDTMQGFDGLSDKGGDIWLNRTAVDFHSRASLIRLAAHELAAQGGRRGPIRKGGLVRAASQG